MRTYRQLFRTPEFTPLFVGASAQVAASTVAGLALGSLVYVSTGSPLLSALSMFGPSFAQVAGAMVFLSTADRVPPRAILTALAAMFGVGTLVMALPGMPVWGMFAVIFAMGLVQAAGSGVRWGLLSEILPEGGYILGRSVFNMSVGVMQIAGYGLGGTLVALLSPRAALFVAAGLDLLAAAVVRFGLTRQPPRATGRPSVRETWRGNARLWASPERRRVYVALWVPNGLVVGCEALFIPYAPDAAGVLFMAAAFGMLAGDTLVGRFLPQRWRVRLTTPLRVLLAVPYLLFVLPIPLPVAAVAAAVASAGFGAGLLLQDRLIALTPDDLRGQALGLHSSGMMTMQAVGAAVAGLVAQHLAVGAAMSVMAVLSLLTTTSLVPRRAKAAALAGAPD
ncbi:MFS transporter [Sphaerisporangium aureirubrum]|uniref:MFS transporter n=1 Tax=Sphaerisporangium aureirubrum TaxID=1544736 RepID=A0ABW1NVY2_9ACTN